MAGPVDAARPAGPDLIERAPPRTVNTRQPEKVNGQTCFE